MKKFIVTMMIAVSALIVAPAIAQSPTTATQQQTCQQSGKCKGCAHKGKKCKKGCRKGSESPVFNGIEMTAEQKAQVDTICTQAHATFRVSCQQAREAKAKEIDVRVKEVLTPEQFSVYTANKEQLQERRKAKCSGQGCKAAEKQGAK